MIVALSNFCKKAQQFWALVKQVPSEHSLKVGFRGQVVGTALFGYMYIKAKPEFIE